MSKIKNIKLSEMDSEHGFNFINALIVNIEPLLENKDFDKFIKSFKPLKDETVAESFHRISREAVKTLTFVTGSYRQNLYTVLAIKNKTTVDEIKKQNFLENLKELKNILNDDGVIDFLPLSMQSVLRK
jgi:hypothetical protein